MICKLDIIITAKHLFYDKVSLLTYEALSKTSNIQHRFHGEESHPSPFARKYLAPLQWTFQWSRYVRVSLLRLLLLNLSFCSGQLFELFQNFPFPGPKQLGCFSRRPEFELTRQLYSSDLSPLCFVTRSLSMTCHHRKVTLNNKHTQLFIAATSKTPCLSILLFSHSLINYPELCQ